MKKKLPILLLLVLLLATLTFIWGNSMKSTESSQSESMTVLELVKPVLEPLVGADNVTDHLVRKLAHFIEFGVLGCELVLLAILRKRHGVQPVCNCMTISLTVALIDETIQLFSERGSQVQDVWLDFAGALAGIILILLVRYIIAAIRRKRRH